MKRVLPDEDCFRWDIHAHGFFEELSLNPPIPRNDGPDSMFWTSHSNDKPERDKFFQINMAISGILGHAVATWLDHKRCRLSEGGRPPDVVTTFLAAHLLALFLEVYDKAARLSVATSEVSQAEAGRFHEFCALSIAPLNRFFAGLPKAYGARQISPTQVARRGLRELADRQSGISK